ncbi:MAG TPA: hypothetical protein VG367_06155 [Mucilaginibacter sp.]|jgi:hypothetical protein|nr:hypothetical protein [Mucilaginibacter sp.]
MNRVFKLKASIALFAILFCQAELRAQSVSQVDTSHVLAMNIDTNLTKKPSSAIRVTSDTALIVKAGATIVQKADTTMVISADPELIRKFNEIVAAKQKQSDQLKQDNNPPAVNVPTPSMNAGSTAAVTTGAATSAVAGAAKTDASIPATINNNNNATPANSNSQPTNNANSTQVASSTPANNPTSTQSSKNDATQQTASNANNTTQQNKPDSASTANNNGTSAAATEIKKADTAQQAVSGSTPAIKTDSTLKASNDTTKAKKDTTIKKSDTTNMKKDTALMVTDTASQGVKAVAGYIEVGGAGLAISGNYDARFHNQRDGWGFRVGGGFFSSGGNTVFTVPFQINYLTGEHSMHIELGAGTTFMNSTGTNIGNSKWEFDKITGFIATATVGFRYQPEHKGLNFRIAFVPILYDEGIIPAGGVSVGYTFR